MSASEIHVDDLGVDQTGATLATEGIQRGIDRAAESGATLVFTKGRYLTGGLELRSHLTMEFRAGAVLLGSPHGADYADRELLGGRKALFHGKGLRGVNLLGPGTIDGQGTQFPREAERPYGVYLEDCRDIRLENLHMRHSAFWMQCYYRCSGIQLSGLSVDNVSNYSTDGLDLVGCRDVIISDCRIESDDDALCFKTVDAAPCERIAVTDCLLSSHCNALKIGSESYGDFRDIAVSNCVIAPPRDETVYYGHRRGLAGINLASMDGGVVENIRFGNIVMRGTLCPIFLRLGDRGRTLAGLPRKKAGMIRGVRMAGIQAVGAGSLGCQATAVPGSLIENFEISDFCFEFDGGGPAEPDKAAGYPVPEAAPDRYPNPGLHGYPPSYGFFARRVRDFQLRNGSFCCVNPETRPALVGEELEGLTLRDVRAEVADGIEPAWLARCEQKRKKTFDRRTMKSMTL